MAVDRRTPALEPGALGGLVVVVLVDEDVVESELDPVSAALATEQLRAAHRDVEGLDRTEPALGPDVETSEEHERRRIVQQRPRIRVEIQGVEGGAHK
jgi:hypothetical protein